MKLAAMPSAMATVLAALLIVAPVLVGCSITSQGTMKYPKGETYTGALKDGKYSGQGTMVYWSDMSYIGGWKNGEYHGQGILTVGGTTMTGEYKDGKCIGGGIETGPDGVARPFLCS